MVANLHVLPIYFHRFKISLLTTHELRSNKIKIFAETQAASQKEVFLMT